MQTVLKKDVDGIRYLGYLLPLGSTEGRLLSVLMTAENSLHTLELSQLGEISESNVAATVASVNRKAAIVSGRTLILSGRDIGYRLNREM